MPRSGGNRVVLWSRTRGATRLERATVAWCDDPVLCCKWPGRWPSRYERHYYPARWAGLGKRLGLRPGNGSLGPSARKRLRGSSARKGLKTGAPRRQQGGQGRWVSLALRANGPAVCLAQPNGLGIRCPNAQQGQRPGRLRHGSIPNVSFVNFKAVLCCKWPGRWPSRYERHHYPARWAGLGKRLGLRPGNGSLGPSARKRLRGSSARKGLKTGAPRRQQGGQGRWVSLALRANGPAVCLAQPNGLGIRCPNAQQGQRPGRLRHGSIPNVSFVNLKAVLCCKWPGRWLSWYGRHHYPARWAGLGKRLVLRPGNGSLRPSPRKRLRGSSARKGLGILRRNETLTSILLGKWNASSAPFILTFSQ